MIRTYIKKIELDWKIGLVTILLFLFAVLPVNQLFRMKFDTQLTAGLDSSVEQYLLQKYEHGSAEQRSEVAPILESYSQYKAVLPLIIEQNFNKISWFLVLVGVVFSIINFYFVSLFTKPLKSVAQSIKRISRGEHVHVETSSSGAIGTVEESVYDLQNEISVLREKAQVAGMESAWRDISSIMAHEIKNPLTPIRLLIDRLEEKGSSMSEADLLVVTERINRQLDNLDNLVNKFRSFSKEPELAISSFKAEDIINAIAFDLEEKMRTAISGSALVWADKNLFKQIVLNLYKNALQAGADMMSIAAVTEGETVRLSFKDNGSGIEQEKLAKIFLPYITYSENGTGLGLAVVKKSIESMSGEVMIDSKKGEYFMVTMLLPKGESNV